MNIMAISRLLAFILCAALLLLFATADAGEMGVNYGREANDLPDAASVVRLLQDNGITMVRIYDANAEVLRSLANTGIKVVVMLPNENIAAAASDPSYARQWVKSNVAAYYPATQIHAVAVGNEVFEWRPDLNSQLVRAMTNVQDAVAELGLADAVKVSTPVGFSAVTDTFPPSHGRFKDEIAEPVVRPMLEFLKRTNSYLLMNIYPFWAYYYDHVNNFSLEISKISGMPDLPVDVSKILLRHITLDYALGNSNAAAVPDHDTGLKYFSLLDAERDAVHFAMDELVPGVSLYVSETHWPTRGRVHPGGRRLRDWDEDVFTVANAQAYTNNLINRVLSGKTGTPLRPDADLDVYIFALFNENQKGSGPDDIEQNYGLFYPNMQKVYSFDFHGGDRPSWCVANAAVGNELLQAALDFACGHGANCSAIQPGAVCFEPNTMLAHASFAVNSYYQNKGRAPGTCDFNGAAFVTFQEPDEICDPNASWCVANAAVGDARLQAALDWACGHGADCSDIQPGAKCFEPNTKAAHASHAFNSYYQHNHRAPGTCDFAGAASVVFQAPKIGNCVLPWKSSLEETTPMSDTSYAAL